jgi:hypothetical protein
MRGSAGLNDVWLHVNVDDLTPAIHPVGRVHTVGAEKGAVDRIARKLGRDKLIGAAAFAAALFGLFAFGLCHDAEGFAPGRRWFSVKTAKI